MRWGKSAQTFVAHVRRATVGEPCHENTHPFRDGDAFFAHNGHVGRFDELRPRLLESDSEERRHRIAGTTDSEHAFQLTLTHFELGGRKREALRKTAELLGQWTRELGEETELFLNTLWAEGNELVGTKLGRSLWYIERDEPVDCEICGHPHAEPEDDADYENVVFASEKITDEHWTRVPDGSIFRIDEELSVTVEPLFGHRDR